MRRHVRLREYALDQSNGFCVYCEGVATQADHVIPKSRGGADDESNIVATCLCCNATAGDRIFDSLSDKQAYVRERLMQRGELSRDGPEPTHCENGHPWDRNLVIDRRTGGWKCRECGREYNRRYSLRYLRQLRTHAT